MTSILCMFFPFLFFFPFATALLSSLLFFFHFSVRSPVMSNGSPQEESEEQRLQREENLKRRKEEQLRTAKEEFVGYLLHIQLFIFY